jgi:uncharacterized protein DUF3300
VPSDLVLAARYIASNGDPAQIANQPWDDSVKSLVRYPNILHWMDQNLEWTTAVGEAAAARRRSLESPCALWSIFCAKSIADKTVINEPKRFSLSHSTLEGFSSAVLRRKDEHSPSLWLLPGQRSRSSAPHDA